MDDLLGDFLAETTESLDLVDMQLVEFERDPNNAQILDNIFRLVHTIKGTCGFLGLPRLESVAHAAENLMDRFRDGAPVTEEAVSVILEALDRIKEIMGDLESSGEEPDGSDKDLIDTLARLTDGEEASADAEPEAEPEPEPAAEAQAEPEDEADDSSDSGEVSLDELDAAFAAAESDYDTPSSEEVEEDAQIAEEVVEEVAAAVEEPAAPAEKPAAEAKPDAGAKPEAGKSDNQLDVRAKSIRVNVDTLERLMTTVSELVLARNQLLEIARHIDDGVLQAPLQRLSSVTGELQERVMKTRMQPIGNAWQKLPRIIRTLANDLDKRIELEMTGADTELDRQVCELIQDPLTHMVRNAADHGLEDTETRLKVGKPATGKVMLSARHEGGHIVIEIADDGQGLPVDKIKAKAIESGFATAAELEAMSDAQLTKLIFEPGLSTAEAVTNVSGRGVGMDVVRSNIQLIGGSVDVVSVPGEGSKFIIQIPLTLAIVPALIIGAGSQRYAVPQLNIIELVRVRAGDEHSIETVNGSPILRLRGRLLPLVRLASFFDDEKPVETAGEPQEETADAEAGETASGAKEGDNDFVAVFRIGGVEFGMVADAVYDTEEIVVKPLSGFLKNCKAFSGNTILGDGSVVMIIDPSGIAEVSGMRDAANSLEASMPDDAETIGSFDESVSMLVFRAGSEDPKALPLALINRLEEIDMADVERASGQDVVQYRGVLMPLIRLDDGATEGVKPVIVIESSGFYTGLVVDEIVDVVEEKLNIEPATAGTGALGSAVIQGKVTEILDLAYYMPETLEDRPATARGPEARSVLLVDDSAFFRNMLTPFLSAHGVRVTAVASAAEAIEIGRRGHEFDVIVSDLEMPEMTGYQFAEAIREAKLWPEAELIALSGDSSIDAIEKARESGFSDHVAKFDRTRLLEVLSVSSAEMGVAA